MKKYNSWVCALAVAFFIIACFTGCFLGAPTPEEYRVPEGHYRLQADFSNGTLDGMSMFLDVPVQGMIYDQNEKAWVYSDAAVEAAVLEIAGHLSEWTGYAFTLNSATVVENGIVIDWSKDSALVAGLDGKKQNEAFGFDDTISLNWFLMDTLWCSIRTNLPYSLVYYVSEGCPLHVSNQKEMEAIGLTELSADPETEYGGSFYYVHTKTEQ